MICSYEALKSNIITIGVIISIQEYGLLVKLFGDLCGLVPKTEIGQLQTLSSTNVKSQLQQMFFVGQTVSCKVLNFDEEQTKITLSLKVSSFRCRAHVSLGMVEYMRQLCDGFFCHMLLFQSTMNIDRTLCTIHGDV
jgi:predicted RNA-binding protein with RPS1 domain